MIYGLRFYDPLGTCDVKKYFYSVFYSPAYILMYYAYTDVKKKKNPVNCVTNRESSSDFNVDKSILEPSLLRPIIIILSLW